VSDVEFRLLGPVEVDCAGRSVPLGGARDRALVAALLLEAGRVVSLDQLLGAAWGDNPPRTARVQVQNGISRLRHALAPAGAADLIVTSGGGYRIRARPDQLDVHRFDALVCDAGAQVAAGDLDLAAACLTKALSLWRGPALDGLGTPALVVAAQRLGENRMRALETRIEVDLLCGRDAGLTPELAVLVQAHPYRERLPGYLMLALHRTGRRADALNVFRATRALLAEQLGIEPSPDLQGLHEAILRGDDDLAAASAIHVVSRLRGGAVTRAPAPAGVPGPSPVPRQLPADVPAFTGRQAEVRSLAAVLASNLEGRARAVVISAIAGTAGVGKTSLAVHWAHRVADRFPDGQLYLNLRGFDPGGVVSPAEAIRGILDALQVPAPRIPVTLQAQVGLYRSLLAGRRMLIVLDNARDADQVRPLLPGASRSLVVVTSRDSMFGLVANEGASLLTLDLLSPDEARQFLAGRLGADRVSAEPQAVDDIIDGCARLPLALAVVAARAATHATFPLHVLARELRERRDRLDALAGSEATTDVRAVFSWSYLALNPPAARLFRLLGIHPGPDLTAHAAASLAGVTPRDAHRLLAELTRAHLVAEHRPGRYRSHDLLRAYATELVSTVDDEDERRTALHRVLDHYVRTATAAALLISPSRDPVPLPAAPPGVAAQDLADARAALSWFSAEYRVLLATMRHATGFDRHVVLLGWALADFLDRQGHWDNQAQAQEMAVRAAQRLSDVAGQAYAERSIARAHARVGRYDQAFVHFELALRLFAETGDRIGQAYTHRGLSFILWRQGRNGEALQHAQLAYDLYEAGGHRAGQAHALNNIGWCHALLGELRQGVAHCERSLALHRELGDRHGEAATQDSLGYAYRHLGEHDRAMHSYREAARLYLEIGDRYYQAQAVIGIGDVHHDTGDLGAARETWQTALEMLEELGHDDADHVRARLAALPAADGKV
jgi:DNA-binding SARP family transcriptional activator/tetratricopeptide (TPR) repeat protein